MDAKMLLTIIKLDLPADQRLEILEKLLVTTPLGTSIKTENRTTGEKALSDETQVRVEKPTTMPPGNILVPKGKICTCELCKAKAYEVIADVTDATNIPIKVFSECFNPPIDMNKGVWPDEYGNIAACCPVCKGEFTVWIKGKGEVLYADQQDNSNFKVNNSPNLPQMEL